MNKADIIKYRLQWQNDEISRNEYKAILHYLMGKKFCVTTFIDEETMILGYGNMIGVIGIFEFELPMSFRKEKNIMGGCRTWDEFFEYERKRQREDKLKRILK